MKLDGNMIRRAILTTYCDGRKDAIRYSDKVGRGLGLDRAKWSLHELCGMLTLLRKAPADYEREWLVRLAETAFDSLQKRIDRRRNEVY